MTIIEKAQEKINKEVEERKVSEVARLLSRKASIDSIKAKELAEIDGLIKKIEEAKTHIELDVSLGYCGAVSSFN